MMMLSHLGGFHLPIPCSRLSVQHFPCFIVETQRMEELILGLATSIWKRHWFTHVHRSLQISSALIYSGD